jgi:hypothetical protein
MVTDITIGLFIGHKFSNSFHRERNTMSKVYDLLKTTVFAVTDPNLITVDFAELERRNAENRAALDAARAVANGPSDSAELMRQEYEELERRVKGQPTEQACKQYADEQASKHADVVTTIEDEIKYVTSLLDSPGATKCIPLRQGREPMRNGVVMEGCSCDVHVFRRKISALETQLSHAKSAAEKSVRTCGAMIRSAKEIDQLRPRYVELEKIFRKIDTARKVARGLQHPDGDGLHRQSITSGDRHGMKSRHLRWEP